MSEGLRPESNEEYDSRQQILTLHDRINVPPNATRKLIGLEYEREKDTAPRVSLKTADSGMFREVLRLAKKYNVPVLEKPVDVSLLFSTPLDNVIPEKLYKIVAVILKTIGM